MFWAEPPHRNRVNGLFFVFLFCTINCSTLHAEKLPVKTYTTADGLGRDQINRIVQDSHGSLWFCTVEGLSRFDGYKFTNYTTANGLANNAVSDLLETRDGTYLIATANGLSVLNPHGAPMFSNWRAPEKGAEEITVLLEDHKGRIWCGTIAGLRLDLAERFSRAQLVILHKCRHTPMAAKLIDSRFDWPLSDKSCQ